MKASEIRKLTDEEIQAKVVESKKQLLDLRIKNATGSLEKPYEIHKLKKDVARMLTILKERQNKGGNN